MADRRGILVPLIIVAVIFLSPDPYRPQAERLDKPPSLQDIIVEEQRSLSTVQLSTWDDNFGSASQAVNLTGLEPDRGFAWDGLFAVKTKAREQLEASLGSWGVSALDGDAVLQERPHALFENVTGYVRGKWMRSILQDHIVQPQLNLSLYAAPNPNGGSPVARDFRRNITGSGGDITVRFHEKQTRHIGMTSASNTSNITDITAEMRISDSSEHELLLHGVYFVDIGQAVLTTTSDKLAGIYMLPHMSLSPSRFLAAKTLLNQTISRQIDRQVDGLTSSRNPFTSQLEGNSDTIFTPPKCEMVVYLQQMPPHGATALADNTLRALETELRHPTGASVSDAPDMNFSMLIFSPDCGFVLESKGYDTVLLGNRHLVGPKMEVQYRHSRKHLLVFNCVLALQLFLLMRQMREASTPSTRSRISFFTVALLALGDGFVTMTFLFISLFLAGLSVNLVCTAFLALINVSFFGMRFLMDIWAVQAPERISRAREELEAEQRRQTALQVSLARIRAAREAGLPLTVHDTTVNSTTQPAPPQEAPIAPPQEVRVAPPQSRPAAQQAPVDTGATPVFFMPSDQEDVEPVQQASTDLPAAEQPSDAAIAARLPTFAAQYTRFYLLLLVILFLSLNATSWPSSARRIFFLLLSTMSLTLWLPQVLRNIQRNCRHALDWEFVLGQSLLRLVPFAYFYGYKGNVLFVETDYISLSILIVWVWIQICLLASQEVIGPRWFVKQDWAPPAWDYHPILRADEEGGLPVGFADASSLQTPLSTTAPSSPTLPRRGSLAFGKVDMGSKSSRIFDCAICMQDLEVPIVQPGGAADPVGGGLFLARRAYMVTPCRHIFHTPCLEGWMKYRLQCPNCRETLPPL